MSDFYDDEDDASTRQQKAHIMLAGGLNPDNAASANAQGFYGLDFNSGLETAPGIKSAEKIQTAFAKLRL